MGLPGWTNWISISCSLHHHSNSLEVNSGLLSVLMTWGLPRHAITLPRVLIMRLEDSEVSISMAKASRVQSSMTLKVRNLRTPKMLSLIKSMLQLLLTANCRLVAGPSLFLRTGPSKAGYPSPGQRTSSLGANFPPPGFWVSGHRTHPTPRI